MWLEQLKKENEERYSWIQIQKKIERKKKSERPFPEPKGRLTQAERVRALSVTGS